MRMKIFVGFLVVLGFVLAVVPILAQSDVEEEVEIQNSDEYVYDAGEVERGLSIQEEEPVDESIVVKPISMDSLPDEPEPWHQNFTWKTAGYGVLMLFSSALWLVMLIDAIRRPLTNFPGSSGGRKTWWIILVLLTHVIGGLTYYFAVYRRKSPQDAKE